MILHTWSCSVQAPLQQPPLAQSNPFLDNTGLIFHCQIYRGSPHHRFLLATSIYLRPLVVSSARSTTPPHVRMSFLIFWISVFELPSVPPCSCAGERSEGSPCFTVSWWHPQPFHTLQTTFPRPWVICLFAFWAQSKSAVPFWDTHCTPALHTISREEAYQIVTDSYFSISYALLIPVPLSPWPLVCHLALKACCSRSQQWSAFQIDQLYSGEVLGFRAFLFINIKLH